MLKCGNQFCSKPRMGDTQKCRDKTLEKLPTWKGVCYWQRDGAGCKKCGGKVVRAGASAICTSCGSQSYE